MWYIVGSLCVMISVLVLSVVYCGFIGGVMISVLVLSVVYCGFIDGVMIIYCGASLKCGILWVHWWCND